MTPLILPDRSYLHERFFYDEISGALIWRERPRSDFQEDRTHKRWNTQFAGTRAGHIGREGRTGRPYWRIDFDGRRHLQHRLIFVWMTGSAPDLIDHHDTDGLNNAWENLRPADKARNGSNSPGHKNKRSGLPKGVSPNGRGWSANIMARGVLHYLGIFKSPEDAHNAYCKAALKYHGEFANFGSH